MRSLHLRTAGVVLLAYRLRLALLAGALGVGCVQEGRSHETAPSTRATVFGGQGAQVATADERPLPPADSGAELSGPCGRAAPASDTALLDDFEDGDGTLFKGFEREGYWFSVGDKTDGSVVKPNGKFLAELLPQAEATHENRYAAHLTASGQKDWGAAWGSTLAWVRNGVRCPLNLSAFGGVRFRAKGPDTIRVVLAVPEVQAKEYGGVCTARCYDAHGKPFVLGDRWDSYVMRWDRLQQEGWGVEARFTPARLVQFLVKVTPKSLPIDFWIDDIELIPKDGGQAGGHPQTPG
jgi:hypothetical protein